MQLKEIGNTGIKISRIGFGCASIGCEYGIKINGKSCILLEKETSGLVDYAINKGINFFDTAPAYGRSEEILGKALKGKRHSVIIGTKLALILENGMLPSKSVIEKKINNSINKSLKLLKTDYIDILQIHEADKKLYCSDVLNALYKFKKQGKVKLIGASTYGIDMPKEALEKEVFDALQVAYNLIEQQTENVIFMAKRQGVGIIVRSALMKGILTDKRFQISSELNPIVKHIEKYNSFINGKIESLSDLAIKFVLSNSGVTSTILGMDKKEYIDQAVKNADTEPLSSETMNRLKKLKYPDQSFIDMKKWTNNGWL
ncbi:aldo/keto reductase [bacterium]|nr:aldo/keto reductase [bacterium]